MYNLRRFGNMIQKCMADKSYSDEQLANEIQLDKAEVNNLYKGRLLLTLEQINQLTSFLNEDLDKLLEGDDDYYEQSYVHCMKPFKNKDNREFVLDIIDSYLDVHTAAFGE